MALQYFLYNTDYNNTLVNSGDNSFTPVPPFNEIYIDYFIPETQPLYLYKVSGSTIVINDQLTIDNYINNIVSPIKGSDYVNYFEYTGYTGNTNTRLNGIDSNITYISGVTDTKLNTATFNSFTGTTLPANYYNKTQINAYTGATQTLIGTKQNTITGAATTITTSNLTVSRALISDASGKVVVSTVTSTELGYLSGASSGIQSQLNLKANIASPTLTGVPTAPTAAVNTNTTQIATTAYVVGQAANVNPLVNGTVAIGTSLRYARQDHVHPTDTSRQATITGAATTITTTNLTADRVLVSNGSGKVDVSTVTSTQLATSVAKVFGDNYQYVQDLTSTSTNSTSPQTKLTLTTPSLPAGIYRVNVSWISNRNSASNSARYDVTLNGTPQGTESIMRIEFKDVTNQFPLSRNLILSLSGVNTLVFRYWGETTSNRTTVSDATMEIYRVQ